MANKTVLQALEKGELSGAELVQATGMPPAFLYPELMILEGNKKISSRWLEGPFPRRRLYSLIKEGSK